MLGSTWSEAFQRGGQDGKEATHSGADHHCTAGGRGRSGPRQIREADQPGASRTHDGRALKLLTVLDEHTRECLAIVVARKIRSHDVLEVLADLFVRHGPPEYLRSDNGPEFTAKLVRRRLGRVGVALYVFLFGAILCGLLLWLGSDATGMAEAKDLSLATLPIGSGILAYWFAARGRSSSGDNDK